MTFYYFCSIEDIACRSDPCHHGGTCENVATGGFKCTCQPGYTGQTCDDRGKLNKGMIFFSYLTDFSCFPPERNR